MSRRTNESGFSLIEIMVVLGVIALLTGIAVPAYYSYIEKGKTAEVMSDLKSIETAIIALAVDTGVWPNNEPIGKEGSSESYDLNTPETGLTNNDDNDFSNWNGPYMTPPVPLDPWGSNYFFDPDYNIPGGPSQVPVVGSLGPRCVLPNWSWSLRPRQYNNASSL